MTKKFPAAVLNVIKILGDMIPAAQGAQVWAKIFGNPASDTLAGFGGLVSALITSYQLYEWLKYLNELIFNKTYFQQEHYLKQITENIICYFIYKL